MGSQLISVEHELPAIDPNDGPGVPPEVFTDLWEEMEHEGWERDGIFAVSRKPSSFSRDARGPEQVFTTDAGPTLEIATSPAETVGEIETQLLELRSIAKEKLSTKNVVLLGSGVHPYLGTSQEEYLKYRTPRKPYDYANDRISGRGWSHKAILNIAALQEIVDIPARRAPAIVGLMHKLTGLFLFLLRNDPDYHSTEQHPRLSVRPSAWRTQVEYSRFPEDRHKVGIPDQEVTSWTSYLRLLWETNPMFMLGTKDHGLAFIPEHPSFAEFIASPPPGGWAARSIESGENIMVVPDMSHVAATDWSYMGLARLRLFWKEETDLAELIAAYRTGDERTINEFVVNNTEKILLENRSSATPPPGAEMCSLALVVGLLNNLEAGLAFSERYGYEAWSAIAAAAEKCPFDTSVGGLYIPTLVKQLVDIASKGLLVRGLDEEKHLEVLYHRIHDKLSSAEVMLALGRRKGIDAVIEKLRY